MYRFVQKTGVPRWTCGSPEHQWWGSVSISPCHCRSWKPLSAYLNILTPSPPDRDSWIHTAQLLTLPRGTERWSCLPKTTQFSRARGSRFSGPSPEAAVTLLKPRSLSQVGSWNLAGATEHVPEVAASFLVYWSFPS